MMVYFLVWLINLIYAYGIDSGITINENPNISENRQKAIDWLFSVRNEKWGWGTDYYPETHRIFTAIILSNPNYMYEKGINYEKTLQQLKSELSVAIFEKNMSISAGQLALYANALKVNCLDPQNFNGVNIISKMIEKTKISNYESGLVLLSACLAKEERDFSIDFDLLNNLDSYFIDSRAMIVMALICIREKYKEYEMDKYIQKQVKSFKALQTSEGNFGNVYTSALLIQALIASENSSEGWSFENAMHYLISQQKKEGSFGDLLATYFVLPILSGRSFVDINNIDCQEKSEIKISDYEILDQLHLPEIQDNSEVKHIQVTYSVWSEKNVSQDCYIFRSKKFTVPENSIFLDVMKIAQKQDSRYRFKASKSSWGSFIEEIDGIRNDVNNHYYWMLYKINERGNLIMTSNGVDKERPKNDDHYIFKYCIGICQICEEK